MAAEARQSAIELRNHWWWRPGWERGTRYYTWHLTFGPDSAMERLVRKYQEVLSDFSFLDPVPIEWLHLTLVGVGQARAVTDLQVSKMMEGAQSEIAELPPISLTFEEPRVLREAVALIAEPNEPLSRLREILSRAVTGVRGTDVPTDDPRFAFSPHVTMAYVNANADGQGLKEALERTPAPAAARVSPVLALIELRRDNRQYEWRTVREITL